MGTKFMPETSIQGEWRVYGRSLRPPRAAGHPALPQNSQDEGGPLWVEVVPGYHGDGNSRFGMEGRGGCRWWMVSGHGRGGQSGL